MDTSTDATSLNLAAVRQAQTRLAGQTIVTPCNLSETFSAMLGCQIYFKFENLQFTSSFKERGALNYLLANQAQLTDGIVAMSAGNHAQALAYHGRRLGIPTTIVMPRFTPNAKVDATRVFGAEVILEGADFDATKQFTESLATERGLTLIHPFDDPLVIAGQGTVALEMLEQVPDLEVLVVPVGGGGLIGGVAMTAKAQNPEIEVIGVQMERYPGAFQLRHQNSVASGVGGTVAEGIAVKSPGVLNRKLLDAFVDELELVSEMAVEQAIFDMLEIEKSVVEGAGAAPLALVQKERQRFKGRKVGLIVSGGNIDMMILSSVLTRSLARSNRLVRLRIEIPDTPGALAALTSIVGGLDSNIIDIEHHRAFAGSSVRATVVELLLQMRGEEQRSHVIDALQQAGYEVLS